MDQLEYVIEELERALRVWLHAQTDRNLMLVQPDVVEDALPILKALAASRQAQYPTWGDWFAEQGELAANWRDIRVVNNGGTGVIGVFYQRIPADIAEKLGIEPEEC